MEEMQSDMNIKLAALMEKFEILEASPDSRNPREGGP